MGGWVDSQELNEQHLISAQGTKLCKTFYINLNKQFFLSIKLVQFLFKSVLRTALKLWGIRNN